MIVINTEVLSIKYVYKCSMTINTEKKENEAYLMLSVFWK